VTRVTTTRRSVLLGSLATAGSLAARSRAAYAQQQGPGVTDTEIKLGAWMPLSGPIALYGVPQRAGIDAYFQMVNAAGGIKGRKITYLVEDNAFHPEATVSAARKLISVDQVLAIVHPNGTANSAAAFPYVLDQENVPIINAYGGDKSWYFPPRPNLYGAQVLFENDARTVGRWAAKDGHRKLIVVHSAFGQFTNIAVNFAPGVHSVAADASVELYPVKFGTSDYAPIALELASKRPDAIYAVLTIQELAQMAKQLQQQGFKTALYSYAPSVANSLIELGGAAVEGLKATSWTVPPTLATQEVTQYRSALNKYAPSEKPDYISLFSFAMAKIFVELAKRIEGPLNRESLVAAVETMKSYDTGLVPPVSYGPERHLGITELRRLQIKDGKWGVAESTVDTDKDW